MKLVKLFNKLSAVALAASLVVGFASCSTPTDDPFNPNAPLTLEEYVKSEIKKAIENGGAQAKPEDPSKPGKPSGSGSLKEPKSLEFHVNANSTNAENTMIFVKYDRSAYGAEEVKVTDAELNLYINDVKVKTYNEIVFALDEYGAEITSRGPISDPKAMKEYKAKLSVGKAVKSGETVKIELVKASVVKVGAASDKITLANLQFALIDTDPSVDYYKELAPNAEQFQNICALEDLTTGEDTESKPEPEPTPEPEPEDSGLLSKAADLDWGTPVSVAGSSFASATDDSSIKITYVSNADNDYHKFKMMCGDGNENELFEGEATGFTIDTTSEKPDDLHGCDFAAAPSETPAVITYKPSTEEWAKIKAGEFRLIGYGAKITKIELGTAAGGENNAGGEGDNGAGESTSKTYGLCKKYTVTTTKDIVAGDFAFVLQIDNDGEQSADGLKIDVTDFEMEVKVGNDEPFTYSSEKISMIPNAYSNPQFEKTDCRFVLDKNKAIGIGTVITVQVKKATVSNKAKADSIIYVFNEDGANKTNPTWDQYVSAEDNYKPIFAANEI